MKKDPVPRWVVILQKRWRRTVQMRYWVFATVSSFRSGNALPFSRAPIWFVRLISITAIKVAEATDVIPADYAMWLNAAFQESLRRRPIRESSVPAAPRDRLTSI